MSSIMLSQRFIFVFAIGLHLTICQISSGLDESVIAINGQASRELLGDGTNVVVGVIDSGIDDTNAAFTQPDSLGRQRLVAEKNFVTAEPDNTGHGVHSHGTAVAGVILSRDPKYTGLAPDARFLNARALDARNRFSSARWVEDAAVWAINNNADILNLSLNIFGTSSRSSSGDSRMDRILDWAAYSKDHAVSSAICVGNIHDGANGKTTPRSPAGSFNGIIVGHTVGQPRNDYDQVHHDSAFGPTSDNRMKPDIVAPGTGITTTRSDSESFSSWTGCSLATPHVAGVLTQLTDYGKANSLSTSPAVLKANLLNSADKNVRNRAIEPWAPGQATVSDGVWETPSPLNPETGAGRVDALAAAHQYRSGPQSPGMVEPTGWNSSTVSGEGYEAYELDINPGEASRLTTTLTWLRHVERMGPGSPHDAFSTRLPGDALDNLDLQLFRDSNLIAQSISMVDNVEHIHWTVDEPGRYQIRVLRKEKPDTGIDEEYSLAWRVTGLPGDFDADGRLLFHDIDQLTEQVSSNSNDPFYDLNQDGMVDQGDRQLWVEELAGTYFGDANLNQVFDTSDLVLVSQSGEFEDGLLNNSTWQTGDWNGDAEFDTADFVAAFQHGGYETGPRPATHSVPEPNSVILLCIATACVCQVLRKPIRGLH